MAIHIGGKLANDSLNRNEIGESGFGLAKLVKSCSLSVQLQIECECSIIEIQGT